jgi:hypothetical protein
MLNLAAWLIPLSLIRFDPADSDKVDQERRLGSETYNDEISYEFTERSDQEWASSLSGYRVTAGSFNMSEFYFCEDIRLRTGRDGSTRLNFNSRRYQNLINDKTDREIRLEQRIGESEFYWALLADGDSVKSFADLGTGLAFESDRFFAKLDYWSVDHFYNTKTLTEPDQYQQRVYAVEFETAFKTDLGSMMFMQNYNSPVDWQRPSLNLQYGWRENLQTLIWQSPKYNFQQIRFSVAKIQKTESLHEQVNSSVFTKSLEHSFTAAGLDWIKSLPKSEDLKLGIRTWFRDANYEYSGSLPDSAEPRLVEPDSSRREIALYLTRYRYFRNGSGAQFGLHMNRVRQERDISSSDTESKFQTAYDWRLAENANMFWNFTWDLDQLARNFPYRTKPFRPWGGGNIQINIVF